MDADPGDSSSLPGPGAAAPGALLIDSTIHGVMPLGAQMGIWPKRSLPEPLEGPIFGPPGGAPANSYGVLDAAAMPGLTARLDRDATTARCLMGDDAAQAEAAPWLVAITPGDDLMRKLFTAPDHGGWWDRLTGIFLRSTASLDALQAHLHPFLRQRGPSDRWHFLRFWDGAALVPYLHALGRRPARLARWFTSDHAQIAAVICADGTGWRHLAPGPDLTAGHYSDPTPEMRLEQDELDAFDAAMGRRFVARLDQWLRDSHATPLETGSAAGFVSRQVASILTHGVQTEYAVARIVTACWIEGRDFSALPDSLKAMLDDADSAEGARADRLLDSAMKRRGLT